MAAVPGGCEPRIERSITILYQLKITLYQLIPFYDVS